MLWLKAFHIVFVVTWFAGLFYLPRLFVYHAETAENVVREQLKVMERRLLVMTHIGGTLAAIFGLALVALWAWRAPAYLNQPWAYAKLLLVLALIGYHIYLVKLVRDFAADRNTRSGRWLRLFNEIPSLLLIAVVLLAVVKPF